MVKIRLKRMGAHKKPFYRIVVADSRTPRDGRFIEEIGYYNPMTEPKEIRIDEEAASKWLSNGAQPTDIMVKLVEVIAKSLVENPDAVEVTEKAGKNSTMVIELKVAPEDMGKVIGKQGRIAKALRSVVKAAATKANKKVVVEIVQ